MKPTPFQILKYLAGTNCRECGFETCLAFATYIYAYGPKTLDKCPALSDDIKKEIISLFGNEVIGKPSSMIDMWENFRQKLSTLDLNSLLRIPGITMENGNLFFFSLNEKIMVTKEDIVDEKKQLSEHDKILIYYYLINAHKLSGLYDFCDYRSFYSKLKVRDVAQEDFEVKLQNAVQNDLDTLKKALLKLGGEEYDQFKNVYDLAMLLHIFPLVPVLILYRKGEEEFAPYCKFMFDRGCSICFDSEGLEHLAEHVLKKIISNL